MNKKHLVFLMFTTVSLVTHGQSGSTLMGARTQGLANSTTAVTDSWSLLNNPAGISTFKNTNIAFAITRTPLLVGANKAAAIFNSPLGNGAVGVGAFRLGDDVYNEHLISAGYSHQLGLAALGGRLDYIQFRAEGFSTLSTLGVTMGGLAHITPAITVGASVSNLNRPRLPSGGQIPVRMNTGLQIKTGKSFLLVAEVEKYASFDPTIKAAFEYQFRQKFFTRSGFNLFPGAAFFGLGFQAWRLSIDYALQYTQSINQVHQVSVGYRIGKKKKSSE